jgi:hypothetical protein
MTSPARHARTLVDWQPIAGLSGVWEIRRTHGVLPLRAAAIQLPGRRVCVYSPVPHAGAGAMDQLRAMGSPILLAPNAFHTLGLPEHARAFEAAPILASDRAFGRIKRKTRLTVEDLRLLEANLSPHVSILQPPDLRTGEVWLSIREASVRAWIVCDAFINFPRLPAMPLGLGLKLLRMGPGIAISATFKLLLKDRRGYREWLLAKIAEERPTMLIPCHGQVAEDDELPATLERVVKSRL